MEVLKLKSNHNIIIAADGSAASGKTTGARKISKKYTIKFKVFSGFRKKGTKKKKAF